MSGQGGGDDSDDHDEFPLYEFPLCGPHLPPGPFFNVLRFLDAKSLGPYSQVDVDNMVYSEGVRHAIRDGLILKYETALRTLLTCSRLAHNRYRSRFS